MSFLFLTSPAARPDASGHARAGRILGGQNSRSSISASPASRAGCRRRRPKARYFTRTPAAAQQKRCIRARYAPDARAAPGFARRRGDMREAGANRVDDCVDRRNEPVH
ncbi:hypothetical protein ACRUJX_14515, partial [Burkholderia pseudomallei]